MGRRYGGVEQEDRRQLRRQALLEAGLEEFGTRGYQRVTVKQICERAGLTQRYFYESFTDREALLVGVYDSITATVRERTQAAIDVDSPLETMIDTALTVFVELLTSDRRRARIMLLEVIGVSPELEARRYRVIHGFADLIVAAATARPGVTLEPEMAHHAAVGLVGAVNQLLVDWELGGGVGDIGVILQVCRKMFAAMFTLIAATETA
ncbi:TetR/AcrR family transcriptional regulator [Williamsia sp. CHRR-6]|uniref:TetR/AcrR family transcriptional regulator n=1 Tax=Williamsia sp. CHRR-6 TaxID=2835871 RepID=UPI001BDA7C73|nr:TetR/AcrR family transcriptional regulator [Williamsia sp. CHRR-6]MBT0567191.1 TetR/AcrR family transcriptional regulator [Williamsia sp. CHRR-6]